MAFSIFILVANAVKKGSEIYLLAGIAVCCAPAMDEEK
jgi:hypothetical protein